MGLTCKCWPFFALLRHTFWNSIFERTEEGYDIWLDEKKKLSAEDFRNPHIVSCDLSPSMMLIAAEVLCNAHVVNDRFHVRQIYSEAVDQIRIDIRRQLIAGDNNRGKSVPPTVYSNGETMRRILARSKHTLMMSQNKWTDTRRHRVNILFKRYLILRNAYNLAIELRQIFNAKISPTKALGRMNRWYERVMELGNNNFRSVIKTFKNHAPTILNYFRQRSTNASAEAFNSKVKIFRSQMRGVRDRDFFIFRLVKLLYA